MGKQRAEAKAARPLLSKHEYLERLQPLQLELNELARWLQHTG